MKNARHEKILSIINDFEIETQEDLAARLREAGFDVTQATVSRDIRQLRLGKIPTEDGKLRYASDSAADSAADRALDLKYKRALRDAFVSAECAGNILVVHTVSGMAMAAAAAIDSLEWPEVLGCIGGDDTVMAAVRTPEAAPDIIERLNTIAAL